MSKRNLSNNILPGRIKTKKGFGVYFKNNYDLYLLLVPALLYFIVFHYLPMGGILIAFQDYFPLDGVLNSPWVGLDNFKRFINSYLFWNIIKNTFGLSAYLLIAGFPIPIILAILISQIDNKLYKKSLQTFTYLPHLISMVVVGGMIVIFLSPRSGIINQFLQLIGHEPVFFMAEPKLFKSIYVISDIWQHTGWHMIIYIAALSSIDVSLYEAAYVDGADRIKRILYIDIPSIMPTIVILLIMSVGKIMTIGFEKAYLLQNDLNTTSSEIIATYVYKVGLGQAQYSYATAIGIFNSVINLILLISVNKIAQKNSENSLW